MANYIRHEQMTRKTGLVLSLETTRKEEMFNFLERSLVSIDAVVLKQPLLINMSTLVITEIKDFMKSKGYDKPIIVDSRLEVSDIDSMRELSTHLKEKGAHGLTILAIGGEEIVKFCNKSEIAVFAIIDIGTEYFRNLFSDDKVVENALVAKKSNCAGVIMSSKHPERIRKVRDAVGRDFSILSTVENECKLGDSLLTGADFEIAPETFFK